ncbi:four helix bundle protein [Lacticaseibacillus rhamnosus]
MVTWPWRKLLASPPVSASFPRSEMFGLTSQIRRASNSIGANLAEGCGRWGDTELARYVQIAMGSAAELQNHLRLAKDLGFLRPSDYASVLNDVTSVRQMLTAFRQKLRGVRKTQQPAQPPLAKSESRRLAVPSPG